MHRHFLPAPPAMTLAAAAALAAGSALAGNESRAHAYPLQNGLVEVVADFSENSIYWCGAATYALSRLSKPGTDTIWIWQGPSPSAAKPGERSVKFGFEPPPGVDTAQALTNDVGIVGNALSVAQAKQTCNERTTSG